MSYNMGHPFYFRCLLHGGFLQVFSRYAFVFLQEAFVERAPEGPKTAQEGPKTASRAGSQEGITPSNSLYVVWAWASKKRAPNTKQ
eukprot:226026-Pyramimonas_sp.AAC.1